MKLTRIHFLLIETEQGSWDQTLKAAMKGMISQDTAIGKKDYHKVIRKIEDS